MLNAYYVCSMGPFNMCFVECIFTAEMLMMDESGSEKIFPYFSKIWFSLCNPLSLGSLGLLIHVL